MASSRTLPRVKVRVSNLGVSETNETKQAPLAGAQREAVNILYYCGGTSNSHEIRQLAADSTLPPDGVRAVRRTRSHVPNSTPALLKLS
jgi:hypothetical protein